MKIIEEVRCFGGRQLRIEHGSRTCMCDMIFSLFLPPQAEQKKVPVIWWLSGLTCTDQNFVTKAGAQRMAAQLGVAVVVSDTSPRGNLVPDDDEDDWGLGLGAGFYVNATQLPWDKNYHMYDYLQKELPELLADEFPVDLTRQSIMGHSMGGHGALTLALRHPDQYRSVSAFAPICSPIHCAWGEKALSMYLGDDRKTWLEHDAVALIETRGFDKPILIEQGLDDEFLAVQLRPELLEAACAKKDVPLILNCREGYDHSYFFIASFIDDHLKYHAEVLVE